MKNISEISWDFNLQIEGILDTGIIVVAHFNNPIQNKCITFLGDIFQGKKRILIPLTTFFGAYHILTSYLNVARYDAKTALLETLNIQSEYFFPLIDHKTVVESLDISSTERIESWDGYLISLARAFQTSTIYSLDQKLKKLTDFEIVVPVSEKDLMTYHEFLEETVFK